MSSHHANGTITARAAIEEPLKSWTERQILSTWQKQQLRRGARDHVAEWPGYSCRPGSVSAGGHRGRGLVSELDLNVCPLRKSETETEGHRFLLRYTSRDSVELLGRGRGGVHEARVCIAKYDEQSPLYGLIVYRRRKFLIKYIPEGTSRLLQGKVQSRRKVRVNTDNRYSANGGSFPGHS